MKLRFSSDDVLELNFVREYAEGYAVSDPVGIWESHQKYTFRGIESEQTRIHIPGIRMAMLQGSSTSDIVHSLEGDFPYLQMHFEITTKGCLYFPKAQKAPVTSIYQGHHALLFYPYLEGDLHYLQHQDGFSVEIELSLDFVRRVFHDDLSILGVFGDAVDHDRPVLLGGGSHVITPAMLSIIQSLYTCPYSGSLKKIFVEAKVMELLTLQVDQINSQRSFTIPSLKPADIDKLMNLKFMLDRDLYADHSVETLSRQVGMNRTKLQTMFKEAFGNTIFGYISDKRLEIAREQLLYDRDRSVAEVAVMAGYKNPQHFTVAFKRKFGVLPKASRR